MTDRERVLKWKEHNGNVVVTRIYKNLLQRVPANCLNFTHHLSCYYINDVPILDAIKIESLLKNISSI